MAWVREFARRADPPEAAELRVVEDVGTERPHFAKLLKVKAELSELVHRLVAGEQLRDGGRPVIWKPMIARSSSC